ncbi:MAG: 50S ribosomal protein P1 [Halobacteriota archaeon]
MEYVYAALMLHSAGKDINEDNVKSVLEAAGVEAVDARIKALVAALEDVNIEEAISKAAIAPAAAPAAAPATTETQEEEEKKEEEEEEAEEGAVEGLGALFG